MLPANSSPGSSEELSRFIRQLRNKGVALWVQDGALRYRAPRGLLTIEDRHTLCSVNGAIASELERNCVSTNTHEFSRIQTRRAPLSFTQFAHWHACREALGRPVRQVASATRLRGRLRIDLLHESVRAVVARHEALRTRIVLSDAGIPFQEVAAAPRARLAIIHLCSMPSDQCGAEVQRQIDQAILDVTDYGTSLLFQPVLLKLREDEHVLILALEHVISDGFSLNLLSEEMFTAYAHLLTRGTIDLPNVTVQFPDYAVRQCAQSNRSCPTSGSGFDSFARTRFPDDPDIEWTGCQSGMGLVRFLIDRQLCNRLREWALRHRTTLVTSALTAYAALVLRWCGTSDTVIQFIVDGRTSRELERAIGYFAYPLYVRAALGRRDTLLDMLKTVTEGYCKAYDEADFGYARAQLPRLEFTRNTCFNWLPASNDQEIGRMSEDCPVHSGVDFQHPLYALLHVDQEPSIAFSERKEGIIGELSYPRERFSERAMHRFAENITVFMSALVSDPSVLVTQIKLT